MNVELAGHRFRVIVPIRFQECAWATGEVLAHVVLHGQPIPGVGLHSDEDIPKTAGRCLQGFDFRVPRLLQRQARKGRQAKVIGGIVPSPI